MLSVSCCDTPSCVFQMTKVFKGFENCCFPSDFCHSGIQTWLARGLKIDELVDVHMGNNRTTNSVKGVATCLPAFNCFSLFRPKVYGEGQRPRVEKIAIFQGFIVLVVLGRQAQCAGLDPHIDVFRNKDYLSLLVKLAKRLNDTQDLIVCLTLRKTGGQAVFQGLGLEKKLSTYI